MAFIKLTHTDIETLITLLEEIAEEYQEPGEYDGLSTRERLVLNRLRLIHAEQCKRFAQTRHTLSPKLESIDQFVNQSLEEYNAKR